MKKPDWTENSSTGKLSSKTLRTLRTLRTFRTFRTLRTNNLVGEENSVLHV